MPSLFQLSQDCLALDQLAEETGGELTPEVEAAFSAMADSLHHDTTHKMASLTDWIADLDMQAKAADDRADYFRRQSEIRRNRIVRIKKMILDYLTETGTSRVESANGIPVRLCANGGKLPVIWSEVIDPATVPDDLCRIRREIDKDKVYERLVGNSFDGQAALPFASLGKRGTHVRIG